MEKNIFQKIIDREIPADIIYEDKNNIVFLDAFPFEKGHLLVVPKKNYTYIWEMPENDFLELQKIILKLSKKINKIFPEAGLNIMQNNKKIAHQEVPHLHFHLCPRFEEKKLYNSNVENYQYYSEEEKKDLLAKLKI